jgi:hypothetical protein
VFDLPASPPNTGTCREVVERWITSGCPLPDEHGATVRLNTPRRIRDAHPTGAIVGMGTIH